VVSRSAVQFRPLAQYNTMDYGLGCSLFFIMFTRMFTKWGQNAVTPIYTHIPPQYAVIMRFSHTSAYNRM